MIKSQYAKCEENKRLNIQLKKNPSHQLAPVAHTCNPSYSGGRDQEDHSLKLIPGKQFMRPYLEKNPSKKGLVG
jgi:hypothetical protein